MVRKESSLRTKLRSHGPAPRHCSGVTDTGPAQRDRARQGCRTAVVPAGASRAKRRALANAPPKGGWPQKAGPSVAQPHDGRVSMPVASAVNRRGCPGAPDRGRHEGHTGGVGPSSRSCGRASDAAGRGALSRAPRSMALRSHSAMLPGTEVERRRANGLLTRFGVPCRDHGRMPVRALMVSAGR